MRDSRCTSCGECAKACEFDAIALDADRPVTDNLLCTRCGKCAEACVNEAREIIGREVQVREVIDEIEKDRVFYEESGGGATLSGGEPLMQATFLNELLIACREREIHTAVDTTCHAQQRVLDEISESVDLFLCDLKHMDSETHEQMTGVGNGLILDNVERLASGGRDLILRVPVVPGFNDDEQNIDATGRFAASLGKVGVLDVLPYNNGGRGKALRMRGEYDLVEVDRPDDERIKAIAERLEGFGLTVRIGG